MDKRQTLIAKQHRREVVELFMQPVGGDSNDKILHLLDCKYCDANSLARGNYQSQGAQQ